MRRLLLVVLASAMALSACGSGKGWPDSSAAGSQAATATASIAAPATPTDEPTAKPSPTAKATPTSKPTTGGTAIDADWTKVEPSGVGFTSMWPGKPTSKTTSSSSAAGPVSTTLWQYEESNDLAYFVGVVTYPKGSMGSASTTKIYDAGVQSMTTSTSVALTIKSQGSVTVQGHVGRSFELTSSTVSLQGAMFVVGDTLYMAYVAYSTSMTDLSAPEVFFNDFSLTI